MDTVLRALVVLAALWVIVVCVETIVCVRPNKPAPKSDDPRRVPWGEPPNYWQVVDQQCRELAEWAEAKAILEKRWGHPVNDANVFVYKEIMSIRKHLAAGDSSSERNNPA